MRKLIPLLVLLTNLQFEVGTFAQPSVLPKGDHFDFQIPIPEHFRSAVFTLARDSRFRARTGNVPESFDAFNRQVEALIINREKLTKAVAEVRGLPADKVTFVEIGNWERSIAEKPQSDRALVTLFQTAVNRYGGLDGSISMQLRLLPSINQNDEKSIANLFKANIAPDVKKASQQFFDERFGAALAEMEKAKSESDDQVRDLENRRRGLQLQSYEELPYEKVADHLADLQRQQLTIKLSLVGMEARENAIRQQIEIAKHRLSAEAARSQEGAASNEMVEALKQLVKLRAEQVSFLKTRLESGIGTTESDVAEASAKLLDAKIQLLTLEAKRQPRISSEQLDSLQSEMTRLAIDTSESKARLEYLERLTEEVRKRIARRADLDQEIKRIDEELPQAKNKLRAAEQRISELNDAKAAFRPIDLTRTDG